MDNMKRVIVVTSLIPLMISGCASVLRLKPISFHYDEIERETTYTTRDLYLIERNVPPYTLKLSVSKPCAGNFVDCEPDYYELVFYSSSYPGFKNHLSFIADNDTLYLGSTRRIGSEFDMSNANVASTMLAEGELLDLISIRSDAFKKIANATRLRGSLGSQNFEISYKMRNSWRLLFNYDMLQTLREY
jgi:hypothetical protein